eukprot:UN04558
MSAMTRPFAQTHLLYTSMYGPLADQGTKYCGQCKFEFDDMYLYTSEPYCESKSKFFARGQCSRQFDWSINPESLRFPPFDMAYDEALDFNKQLLDDLNITLYDQWDTLRRALTDYEKEHGEPTLEVIDKTRNSIREAFAIYAKRRTDFRQKKNDTVTSVAQLTKEDNEDQQQQQNDDEILQDANEVSKYTKPTEQEKKNVRRKEK